MQSNTSQTSKQLKTILLLKDTNKKNLKFYNTQELNENVIHFTK